MCVCVSLPLLTPPSALHLCILVQQVPSKSDCLEPVQIHLCMAAVTHSMGRVSMTPYNCTNLNMSIIKQLMMWIFTRSHIGVYCKRDKDTLFSHIETSREQGRRNACKLLMCSVKLFGNMAFIFATNCRGNVERIQPFKNPKSLFLICWIIFCRLLLEAARLRLLSVVPLVSLLPDDLRLLTFSCMCVPARPRRNDDPLSANSGRRSPPYLPLSLVANRGFHTHT